MPKIVVTTSLPKTTVGRDFAGKLAKVVGEQIGVPEEVPLIIINSDQAMYRGGKEVTVCTVDMSSVSPGTFDTEEKNIKYTRALTDFLTSNLGLVKNQIILSYTQVPPICLSLQGKLFTEMMAQQKK